MVILAGFVKNRIPILCSIIAVAFSVAGYSQGTNAPWDRNYYHLLDRLINKHGQSLDNFHTTFKPYTRREIATVVDSSSSDSASPVDAFNHLYLANDNWELLDSETHLSAKPFWKRFYKTKPDLYSVKEPEFLLRVKPVLHLSVGQVSNDNRNTFINTRGVELHGEIDGKVGFYSFLGENQARFPLYVRNWTRERGVVPHEGFWKGYRIEGYDFFHARGYMSVNATRHINLQFGHDRFFVGNGYRSLILSDFAPPYLFLKLNTKVWKLQYTNLFTQMRADAFGISSGSLSGRRFPEKYMTFHHLSININPKLNIGLFEAINFGREDSVGNNSYDLNYLNPIIFYRAIEQQNGSVDNAILGMDFNWRVNRSLNLYGQAVIDEFFLSEVLAGDGWWGNKFGFQIGAKYFNAFKIPNLDLQLEYNTVRPYTYSHQTIYTSYAHYRQPLAHPLGANFNELVGIVRYQPLPKLSLTGKLILAEYGADTLGVNWGADVLLDNRTRERQGAEQDLGHFIGQGLATDLLFLNMTASYQLRHNFFVDGSFTYRDLSSELPQNSIDNLVLTIALRLNIPQRFHEF